MDLALLIYYVSAGLAVMLGASGIALGQGYVAGRGVAAITRQDLALSPVRRALLIGLTLLESGCVFSLLASLIAIFGRPAVITMPLAVAYGGALVGLGVVAGIVGIVTGRVLAAALDAIARQPLSASPLVSSMLISQVLLEAPTILAFILFFMARSFATADLSMIGGVQIGLGILFFAGAVIGPVIGQSMFCSAIVESMGINILMHHKLFSFMFIVQAIIETPVVFGFVGAVMVMARSVTTASLVQVIATLIGMTITVSLAAAGAGIGSGRVAGRAAICMAEEPSQYAPLFQLALICQTIIDTALIYSIIISFLLLRQCMA